MVKTYCFCQWYFSCMSLFCGWFCSNVPISRFLPRPLGAIHRYSSIESSCTEIVPIVCLHIRVLVLIFGVLCMSVSLSLYLLWLAIDEGVLRNSNTRRRACVLGLREFASVAAALAIARGLCPGDLIPISRASKSLIVGMAALPSVRGMY